MLSVALTFAQIGTTNGTTAISFRTRRPAAAQLDEVLAANLAAIEHVGKTRADLTVVDPGTTLGDAVATRLA
jgi:hypothetical protein